MNIETLSEPRKMALEKWHEYNKAAKQTGNPLYKDLKKVYNQIKSGRKLIDLIKVFQVGGLKDYLPALAIAKAKSKQVWCTYWESGQVNFVNGTNGSWSAQGRAPLKEDVVLKNCLPIFSSQTLYEKGVIKKDRIPWNRIELTAPVPLIPPKLLPANITDDYYVLWEVDEWKMIAPTDPWLLRKITETLFVVVAGWNLTKLEKAVMNGRML